MCCFFFVHTVLENAYCLQQRKAPCKAGVETSCEGALKEGFFCRDPQFGTGQQLELLTARTGGGTYPGEVCRQGKSDNARLQNAAVRRVSVWVLDPSDTTYTPVLPLGPPTCALSTVWQKN